MKKLIFLLLLIFSSEVYAAIELTDEQFQNVDLIYKELKEKDVNFIGLSGSKEKMEILGMGETQAEKEIDKMNFVTLKANDPAEVKRKALVDKFKAIGFDDEMLSQIGLN